MIQEVFVIIVEAVRTQREPIGFEIKIGIEEERLRNNGKQLREDKGIRCLLEDQGQSFCRFIIRKINFVNIPKINRTILSK